MKISEKIKKKPKLILSFVILLFGAIYYIFVTTTGYAVPCFVKSVTGLYCPSCGLTRMCLAILKLDFRLAFKENAFLMTAIPVWLVIVFFYHTKLIKKLYHNIQIIKILLIISIALFIIFGILRNIPDFRFLQPV